MSNPFGEAPPQKPTRPARPPPPNPFGPARQVSVDASKPTSKNPFGSTEPEYPPLPSMSVPLPTVSAPTVPVIPLRPPTPPTIPPETPPAFPPALQAPEILAPSTVPPPLPEDVPPSTPLVAPPAPPLPPSLPPSTPTGAPPPPPAIPPSTPTARAPPPPALPPASPTFSTVEMPENHAPPVPALLPQQTAIGSDGFDFQPVAPQSDPFGFPAPNAAPVAVAFDAAAGSNSFVIPQTAPPSVSTAAELTRTAPAVVVEEPPSLPPPPPQVDDDPYDLHINRPAPVPQPPIATAAPQPRKSFTEDKKPQSKSASGDPFSELVAPLKPTPPPGVSNPFAKPANPLDSLPLNALLAAKQSSIAAAQVAPTSSAPAAFVGAPVAVTASAPVRVATADPFSAPAVPFAAPSVSAAPEDFDLFDQLTAPRAAAPVAPPAAPPVPVISPADFDIFAAKAKPAAVAAKTAAVTAPVDPFAGPIDPFASSQSGAPVVEDDAFDVFGLPKPAPTQQKRPSHTLPVPPVPAKAAVAHKAAPAPKATVPPPLETSQPVISHAKRQASTTAPTAAPPEPEFIFSPADYRKTNSQSFDLVADDPFASSVAPAHANDLFDDPFATHADPRDKEEIDDPLARLRQTYGLSAQHSDDEDEHHHDPSDVLHDAFDDFDDFTFDQAHHGGRTAARPGGDLSRPTKQSASGRSAGSAATSKSAGSASSGGVDEDGVLAQGEILSRLSTKAMLTRDWHDTYYAIVKDHLYVFRHRADYFQYQAQAQNRRVQRGSTEDASPLYKKRIDLVYNLKLEPIKGKEYKTLGMVYNFSLELIEDYGPKDLGKFGSTDRETVQTLWNHIRDVVMAKRKERAAPRPTYG